MTICFRSKSGEARLQRVLSRAERPLWRGVLTKETPIAVRRGFPGDDEERSGGLLWRKSPHCWVMSP